MPLNWTVAFWVLFFATFPELLGVILCLHRWITTRYVNYQYMVLTWGFLWIGNLFLALGYLTLNYTIYKIGIILSIPLTYGIVFLTDSITREKISTSKLVLTTFISTLLLGFAFQPNIVEQNTSKLGEMGLAMRGEFFFAGSIIFLVAGSFWFIYMLKIHLHAPLSIKKYSRINFIGAIIAGPGSILMFSTTIVWYIPGVDYFFIGIGALLCSYSFWKEPKLGYILPFTVYELIILDSNSGLNLFSYNWNNEMNQEEWLSEKLTNIAAILRESLNRWNLNELKFDQGKLILKKSPDLPITYVLICSRSTKILNQALETFSVEFDEEYRKISRFLRNDRNKYLFANRLVDSTFPFVINYLNE